MIRARHARQIREGIRIARLDVDFPESEMSESDSRLLLKTLIYNTWLRTVLSLTRKKLEALFLKTKDDLS